MRGHETSRDRATAGETLVETLVAILVITLATSMLMISLMASGTMTEAARTRTADLASDQAYAETHGLATNAAGTQGASQVVVAFNGTSSAYDVVTYTGENGLYRSYGLAEDGGQR